MSEASLSDGRVERESDLSKSDQLKTRSAENAKAQLFASLLRYPTLDLFSYIMRRGAS